ncbi:hypothetical protein [Leisingera sp. ANG-M7]|nr:hypothetical protein [Leisingera sp. ANG-M7]
MIQIKVAATALFAWWRWQSPARRGAKMYLIATFDCCSAEMG